MMITMRAPKVTSLTADSRMSMPIMVLFKLQKDKSKMETSTRKPANRILTTLRGDILALVAKVFRLKLAI